MIVEPAAATYDELLEEYGAGPAIPDEVLYNWLIAPITQKGIMAQLALGEEAFSKQKAVIEVRRRSRQDLYWLIAYFLWDSSPEGVNKPITKSLLREKTHRPLCDTFVRKDNTKDIADQDPVFKERIVLYPRGAFKSTIDIADAVQWILNFPEIRILFVTAEDSLAVGFVDRAKGHFVMRPKNPSLMNLFFSEFCVDEKKLGSSFEFTCPVWSKLKVKRAEATIMARSINSTLSGWHFEIIKADDIVNTQNSDKQEACKKVIDHFDIDANMLMSFGYLDFIGTRYSEFDLYGDKIMKNTGTVSTVSGLDNTNDPRPWTRYTNPDTGTIIMIGKAREMKPEAKKLVQDETVKEDQLEEKDFYFLFPESLGHKILLKKKRTNETVFEGQQQQNPRSKSKIVMGRLLLEKRTIPFAKVPIGPVIITWDFAFSPDKKRDFSTAAVGVYNAKGELFIIHLVRKHFTPAALAKEVVDLAQRYHPVVCAIENAGGSKLLEPSIMAEARRRNQQWLITLCKRIDWFKTDNHKGSKKMRMGTMHPPLVEGKLFFVNTLPYLQVLYDEFEVCLGNHHHDDIPDVISQQLRYVPQVKSMMIKKKLPEWSNQDAAWNILFEENCDAFGRPGYGASETMTQHFGEPPLRGVEAETSSNGLDPILGAGLIG
jgi:phage terminase large subunit-like protein